MNAPAKCLFDHDFGRAGRGSAGAMPGSLAEAEARGHRAGYAAAKAEFAASQERDLAAALGRAAAALQDLARGLRAVEGRLEAEAVEVAVAVADKLAPALLAREPLAEIAALATDCFRHLVGAPHVVIRVSEAICDSARAHLEEIAASFGFAGRLTVLADAKIARGDCRIEWTDGGMVRDRAATEAVIAEAVQRYLAVRAPAEPLSGATGDE